MTGGDILGIHSSISNENTQSTDQKDKIHFGRHSVPRTTSSALFRQSLRRSDNSESQVTQESANPSYALSPATTLRLSTQECEGRGERDVASGEEPASLQVITRNRFGISRCLSARSQIAGFSP